MTILDRERQAAAIRGRSLQQNGVPVKAMYQ